MKLEDAAANLLVKPGRVEIALGRATLNKGTVKGRLAVAPGTESHDVKLQGTFDRIDLGAFLTERADTMDLGPRTGAGKPGGLRQLAGRAH